MIIITVFGRSHSISNPIIEKPMDCRSMDWFLYDRELRHEKVNHRNSNPGITDPLDPIVIFFILNISLNTKI